MSRHKLVKNMNLDDELDTFDGGGGYGYEDEETAGDELSPDDKEQMQDGTAKVRSILGPEVNVADKDIHDSLWHYYYDVEKTVTYLLNQQNSSEARKSKKTVEAGAKKAKETAMSQRSIQDNSKLSATFSAKAFFRDCPWLNVPLHRRGEILVEPRYPPGRLLGGASTPVAPKVSKLAALAAARKRKENEKASGDGSKSVTTSVALLDKLHINGNSNMDAKSNPEESKDPSRKKTKIQASQSTNQEPSKEVRKYPKRSAQAFSPSPISYLPSKETADILEVPEEQTPSISAPPSLFARTIFGSSPNAVLPVATHKPPISLDVLLSSVYASDVTMTDLDPFAGPSPDDIVAKAQKSSKGLKGSKSKPKADTAEKAMNGITESVTKTAINDISRTKSKNLDVVKEYANSKKKNAANFVVIGHVDAGKSTLMGRLLYDLKVVDQRTIDRYRKEAETIGKSSFALAWVLDQSSEERIRGVTIDIAMNKFETDKTSFTILDAPGHRDFIPNMIAGASQADFAVLVIDASTGSFESGLKGQTKEHALLVRSLGVQRLIVAINKLDTVSWSRDRFEEIKQQVSAFLAVAGFQAKNISFVPCSGLTGANIVTRAADPNAAWYSGPIFIKLLENSEPITRALGKPLRLTINDIFRGGVQNPLSVSGRMDSGSVQVGDKIIAIPSGESGYIKALDVDSEPADWAVAGQNVTLHLSDIGAVHLKAGDVVCPPSAPVRSVTSFVVKILAFEHVTPMHVDIHRGRLHVPGRIKELVAVLDKGSGAVVKKKPRLVKPGDVARVAVEVDVEGGVPLEAPGRVVLRAGGATVAAGLLE